MFLQVAGSCEEEIDGDATEEYLPPPQPLLHSIKPKPFKEEKTVLEKPESLVCKVSVIWNVN